MSGTAVNYGHEVERAPKSTFQIEDVEYEEARKCLLFKNGARTALVFLSLVPILPIGLISVFFWFRGRKRMKAGEKKSSVIDFAEAENMALTSILFGLCGLLTVLICIEQLKRNLQTIHPK
ncbi:uncharacterized protein LOC116618385 [Nematostella vectensis]|uniref:uncharacterized protein LOC116618385 n=1 Tax=Nematostella vectensis TaxID=45351 RepID=UPI002077636F|nr:uncharacterized protein LOC116618385 [Nematostella vectensis]